MVSVRRPTSRGRAHKLMIYGRYALMGGFFVFLLNRVLSGADHLGAGKAGHDILRLHDQKQRPSRNMVSRQKPPDLHQHRLEMRRHEKEEHDHHMMVDQEREKYLEKHRDEPPSPDGEDEEHHQHVRTAEDRHQDEAAVLDSEDQQTARLSGSKDLEEDEDNHHHHHNQHPPETQKIQYVSPNGEVLEKPEGTGPTKLGFVMDFVYERSHPTFRSESISKIETSRQNHAQQVATALSETNVQPCEYLEDTSSKTPRLLQHKTCRDPERPLVVYNSASFPRTWCGVSIPPHSAARMEQHQGGGDDTTTICNEPVHLLERDFPPVNGQGMSPIVIHAQGVDSAAKMSSIKLEEVQDCTIPCQMEQDMTGFVRYVQGTDWTIFQSDQDPDSKKELQMELSKYKHDEYFSTAYFKSDVPLSRFDFAKHNLRNALPPVPFEDTLDKAIYMVDNQCGSTNSRRTRWLETLENQYHVDSVGKCHHTKDIESGESLETLEGRLAVMKKYKFNLGFEISTHKDWITELSYEALLSGAVPILLGASNANRHFPKNGAIYTSDFNSWDKLAAHVNEVATNKELWESYHAWRTDETILSAFEQKYQFTKTSPECRLCSWAYAKMYGLGWDHQLQVVKEPHLPRKLCVDDDSGMILKPFRETWSVGSSPPQSAGGTGCSTQSTINKATTIQHDDWTLVKSVVQHDSVTDFTIHEIQTSDEVILTLSFEETMMNNTEAAFFRNSHTLVETERGMLVSSATIQDHKSKVTVLANWETNVWSPKQGVIGVVIQQQSPKGRGLHADEVRRIRVISEDMGQLHDKMTEYFPSSFSKRMIQDFVDPLEVFYLDS